MKKLSTIVVMVLVGVTLFLSSCTSSDIEDIKPETGAVTIQTEDRIPGSDYSYPVHAGSFSSDFIYECTLDTGAPGFWDSDRTHLTGNEGWIEFTLETEMMVTILPLSEVMPRLRLNIQNWDIELYEYYDLLTFPEFGQIESVELLLPAGTYLLNVQGRKYSNAGAVNSLITTHISGVLPY